MGKTLRHTHSSETKQCAYYVLVTPLLAMTEDRTEPLQRVMGFGSWVSRVHPGEALVAGTALFPVVGT